MTTSVHQHCCELQNRRRLSMVVAMVVLYLAIGCAQAELVSKPLTSKHWTEVEPLLVSYLLQYDAISSGKQAGSAAIRQHATSLAKTYFHAALASSFVFYDAASGELFGALLVIPRGEYPQMPPEFHKFVNLRRDCLQTFAQVAANNDEMNDMSEVNRYIRLVRPGNLQSLNQKDLQQFTAATMRHFHCQEFRDAGEHTLGIFVNRNSKHHFLQYGYEEGACGPELWQVCTGPWFAARCLLTRSVSNRDCPN